MTQPGDNKMSDLIYQFIDGETDSTQQNVLFKSLADNPELQSEFQEAIFLNKALVNDSRVLTPSNELANSLFINAGFPPAVQVTQPIQPVTGSGKGFWSGFIGKFKSSLIPASVGSIITAALMMTGIYVLDIGNNTANNAGTQKNTYKTSRENYTSNNVPVIKSESSDATTITGKNNFVYPPKINKRMVSHSPSEIKILTQSVPQVNDLVVKDNASEPENNNSKDISIISFSKPSKPLDAELMKPGSSFINSFSLKPVETANNITEANLGLLLEIKGISGLVYAPWRSITDDSKLFMKNVALNLFYKLSRNNYFGIETGNESLQMFRTVTDSAGNINFVKEPDLFYINCAWRHNFREWELMDNLIPFTDVSAGYTKWGAVGKAIVGLYYNPENRLSFGLGLEGTALQYTFQLKTKFTEKLGLVYFLGYNF